jgi:hypothetical protein
MRCPGCGSDNPDSRKFCTSCGKTLGDAPTQVQPPVPQPTAQMPPVPAAPVYAPAQRPPVKAKSSKKSWIIALCIIIGLIVVGAAIAIPLIIAASNKPVAQVNQVKIVRADGTTVDADKVPLETEVALKATYKAKFKGTGSGTIRLSVKSSAGESIVDKTFDVTSSGNPQTKEVKFTMSEGSGKPLSGNAKLAVTQGASKLSSAKAVSFKMVAGKGDKLQLKEATAAATKKCQVATETLKATAAKGIDISDLANRLSLGLTTLASAKTVAEANTVAGIAQTVIDECNARITAQGQQQKAADTCRQNQAVIRAKLVDWWGGTGNFPDSMSQLYGIPSCPSGGTYTYYAPDTTPATLHVSCSVHGEL